MKTETQPTLDQMRLAFLHRLVQMPRIQAVHLLEMESGEELGRLSKMASELEMVRIAKLIDYLWELRPKTK